MRDSSDIRTFVPPSEGALAEVLIIVTEGL
jgi:hypothetical protein